MAMLRLIVILFLASLSVRQAPADESLTAESIMARVAANQDRSKNCEVNIFTSSISM
jgi:hypothetical protein